MKRMGLMSVSLGFFFSLQLSLHGWDLVKRLTWTSGDSELSAIAADSNGHLHVVWADKTPGNEEIFYKKSTDQGSTWGPNQRLTSNSGTSLSPAIAVDGLDNIHVVWTDNTPGNDEICYKKSTNGGSIWAPSRRLTWTPGGSINPAIAIDTSGTLNVVWNDATPGNWEVYFKKSTNEGSTWTPTQRLTFTSGLSYNEAIAVDPSGNLHVLWSSDAPGNEEIYYKRSTDGGSSWTPSQRLTWNSGWSRGSVIAADVSGNIHAVWADVTPGNWEIYYKKSMDGGSTWTPNQRLTWNSGYSGSPAIAVDASGNLHLAWNDDTSYNWEIYYKSSTTGGASWTTSQRVTWNSGYSGDPAIAVDGLYYIHVVWTDDTPGGYEIYYKRND